MPHVILTKSTTFLYCSFVILIIMIIILSIYLSSVRVSRSHKTNEQA